jgi:hypothetical protein
MLPTLTRMQAVATWSLPGAGRQAGSSSREKTRDGERSQSAWDVSSVLGSPPLLRRGLIPEADGADGQKALELADEQVR